MSQVHGQHSHTPSYYDNLIFTYHTLKADPHLKKRVKQLLLNAKEVISSSLRSALVTQATILNITGDKPVFLWYAESDKKINKISKNSINSKKESTV